MAVQIEVFSDVVCPWCYVGKRRLEEALSMFGHADEVTVTYRSFQLDPTTSAHAEESLDELLASKYGRTLAEARQMNQRVSDIAATVGLDFDLGIAHPANTLDAHRLLHMAAANGVQAELTERLMRAYFTEGGRLGDHDELADLAAEVGLDREAAAAVLAGDDYADEVQADLALARGFGATGVPFFVFDRKYGISGAQETAVFTDVLNRAWSEAQPLTVVGADTDICTDESCAPAER